MDTITEEENPIESGLYSPKQLFITAAIGGPAIAGFIISSNLWSRDKKLLALIPIIPGLFFGFFIVLLIDSIAHFWGSNYPHFMPSPVLRHIVAFSLYFLFLTLSALLIRFILNWKIKLKAFIFPDIKATVFHSRKIYPLIVISFIYLLTIATFNIYLFIALPFYLFTHIYCYNLIHKAFGNNKIAKPFLVSIVILACLLPLIDATGHIIYVYGNLKLLSFTYLNLVIGYYAIFVLYVFLYIFGLHILLLINRLLKIVPDKILKNKTLVLATIFFALFYGVIILIIGTYINNNPVIKKYYIALPKKSSTLNSLKIISVSDLHLKNLTSTTFLKRLVDKVRLENPDIIFMPGDIVETYGNTNEAKLNEFIEFLKGLKSKDGIYAVRGNHDLPAYNVADKIDFNKRLGITMLSDSLIELENKIYIIGLKYRGNNEKRPIDSLLKFRTKNFPIVLLDHAPYCLGEAIRNNIDVQLSGHTHNGQVWPLSYVTDAEYDIAWGYKKTNNTHLFVSCGVQDAILPGYQDLSIPVRTGSVSEILEINIDFK
jgi:predicted MPP superfamily phosphohydrolase